MYRLPHISFRILYLCFALHIVTFNVCGNFYINFFGEKVKSELSNDFEKDNTPISHSEEIDDINDDYFLLSFNFFGKSQQQLFVKELSKNCYSFSTTFLYSIPYEVVIPPPRA